MQPGHYGLFGLLIAGATVFAARVSYRQSSRVSPQDLILCGAACVFGGGVAFSFAVMMGVFDLKLFGILISVATLFVIFFGIGLIIPNSLSHALKPYQTAMGTAGSIFGGCYYCMIAGFTWAVSIVHNGTALPLPLYITSLGLILVLGCYLTGFPRSVAQIQES